MRFRQQESQETESPIFGTTAGLVDRMDLSPAVTFRAFREVDAAARFLQKQDDTATGSIKRYSKHPNDVRVIVHYTGKPRRERVKLAKARYIVKDGINVNRLLPTLTINFSDA